MYLYKLLNPCLIAREIWFSLPLYPDKQAEACVFSSPGVLVLIKMPPNPFSGFHPLSNGWSWLIYKLLTSEFSVPCSSSANHYECFLWHYSISFSVFIAKKKKKKEKKERKNLPLFLTSLNCKWEGRTIIFWFNTFLCFCNIKKKKTFLRFLYHWRSNYLW